jgi:hypothetical protein
VRQARLVLFELVVVDGVVVAVAAGGAVRCCCCAHAMHSRVCAVCAAPSPRDLAPADEIASHNDTDDDDNDNRHNNTKSHND